MVELKHGTTSGYRYGCRCGSCREAHAGAQAIWRRNIRGAAGPQKHGLSGYMNYGCRCGKCKSSYSSYRRERAYGLSSEDLLRLLSLQNGSCPLCCRDLNNKYVVDHDHRTGSVRGLLCYPCNQALGKFRDDIVTIRSAIAYLT